MKEQKERKKLYGAWKNMLYRCNNPNHSRYEDYGGRGITVCEEWHDFETFYKWSVENGHSEKLSLDRVNNDGMYEPSNCQWSSILEQQNNRRGNHIITINGESKTTQEWCKIYDLNYNTFFNRYNILKWDLEKSITTPVKGRKSPRGFVSFELKSNP